MHNHFFTQNMNKEVYCIKQILNAFLGTPNELLNSVVADELISRFLKLGQPIPPIFQFNFTAVQLSLLPNHGKSYQTIVSWFAKLASSIHICRIWATNYCGTETPDVSSVKATVNELLLSIEQEVCLLDAKISGKYSNQSSQHGIRVNTGKMTLIQLFNICKPWESLIQSTLSMIFLISPDSSATSSSSKEEKTTQITQYSILNNKNDCFLQKCEWILSKGQKIESFLANHQNSVPTTQPSSNTEDQLRLSLSSIGTNMMYCFIKKVYVQYIQQVILHLLRQLWSPDTAPQILSSPTAFSTTTPSRIALFLLELLANQESFEILSKYSAHTIDHHTLRTSLTEQVVKKTKEKTKEKNKPKKEMKKGIQNSESSKIRFLNTIHTKTESFLQTLLQQSAIERCSRNRMEQMEEVGVDGMHPVITYLVQGILTNQLDEYYATLTPYLPSSRGSTNIFYPSTATSYSTTPSLPATSTSNTAYWTLLFGQHDNHHSLLTQSSPEEIHKKLLHLQSQLLSVLEANEGQIQANQTDNHPLQGSLAHALVKKEQSPFSVLHIHSNLLEDIFASMHNAREKVYHVHEGKESEENYLHTLFTMITNTLHAMDAATGTGTITNSIVTSTRRSKTNTKHEKRRILNTIHHPMLLCIPFEIHLQEGYLHAFHAQLHAIQCEVFQYLEASYSVSTHVQFLQRIFFLSNQDAIFTAFQELLLFYIPNVSSATATAATPYTDENRYLAYTKTRRAGLGGGNTQQFAASTALAMMQLNLFTSMQRSIQFAMEDIRPKKGLSYLLVSLPSVTEIVEYYDVFKLNALAYHAQEMTLERPLHTPIPNTTTTKTTTPFLNRASTTTTKIPRSITGKIRLIAPIEHRPEGNNVFMEPMFLTFFKQFHIECHYPYPLSILFPAPILHTFQAIQQYLLSLLTTKWLLQYWWKCIISQHGLFPALGDILGRKSSTNRTVQLSRRDPDFNGIIELDIHRSKRLCQHGLMIALYTIQKLHDFYFHVVYDYSWRSFEDTCFVNPTSTPSSAGLDHTTAGSSSSATSHTSRRRKVASGTTGTQHSRVFVPHMTIEFLRTALDDMTSSLQQFLQILQPDISYLLEKIHIACYHLRIAIQQEIKHQGQANSQSTNLFSYRMAELAFEDVIQGKEDLMKDVVGRVLYSKENKYYEIRFHMKKEYIYYLEELYQGFQ